jgi:glutaminyl-tRNA synthetase
MNPESTPAAAATDFIREIVAADLKAGNHKAVVTRFPPEPNGYLHIGHAKSICLNFGIAREFGGICNLRMDDTNPTKEESEYVQSITEDVHWLIDGWADHCLGLKSTGQVPQAREVQGTVDFHLPAVVGAGTPDGSALEPFYASDYFEPLFEYARRLVRKGVAYVCDLSPEDTDRYRGAPDRPGQESPWRTRSIEENLDLLERMKAGEFPNGSRTLRAKINMASSNVWLRDPVLYRIRHAEHHHTGARWCIYPMYDFAHCLSDYVEGITHSICTLEFEVHRPLYDWILEQLDLPRPLPRQYEFARLNLGYTLLSKRKLLQLVQEGVVSGWNDPRMPTLSGMRRRGVTSGSLRHFAAHIGVTKYNGLTDVAVLEHAIRNDLNARALRRLVVLRPLRLILTNLPPGELHEVQAINNPEAPDLGTRPVPFSRTVYIEQDDFSETPPPKYFRLRPGGEVRLKYACIIRCDEVIKDASGAVVELRCTADLDSRAGGPNANRKVKGTIHWVSADHAMDAEVRLYDRLFTVPEPDAAGDFRASLNPHSLETITAKCEPGLRAAQLEDRFQFERLGYFCLDPDSELSTAEPRLVFNRTITLRDTWTRDLRRA